MATKLPTFSRKFLGVKYWLLWLGLGFFRLILLLPYPILVKIGALLGLLYKHLAVGKKRINIARINLKKCFPQKSDSEIEQILEKNIFSTGMAIIETGIAWFFSDKRLKKIIKVKGLEHIAIDPKLPPEENGIILVGVHFLTLELGARILGLYRPGIGIYRPNNNDLLDYIQTQGRLKSNKDMLDRKDLRGMIKALKQGEIIWYAPDQDYGKKSSVFAPFYAVENTATTTGSMFLLKNAPKAKLIAFCPRRNSDNTGYEVIVDPEYKIKLSDAPTLAKDMNKIVENQIDKAIDQYMWLHKRFKTRPEGEASFYD